MTDKQIVRFCAAFRNGIVGKGGPTACCFMVCWPLATLLRLYGVDVDLVEIDYLEDEPASGAANHVWLRLPDGRALDPTADQFNDGARRFPKVYLGDPVPGIHVVGRER